MQLQNDSKARVTNQEEETTNEAMEPAATETEDTDPVLEEADLKENNLAIKEADQIVWEPPKTGSAGLEEKDITD